MEPQENDDHRTGGNWITDREKIARSRMHIHKRSDEHIRAHVHVHTHTHAQPSTEIMYTSSDDDAPPQIAKYIPPGLRSRMSVIADTEHKETAKKIMSKAPSQSIQIATYKRIDTVVSCAHKIKSKKLPPKLCSMCDMQKAVGSDFRLYSSGMHPGTDGREKIYRWNCAKCEKDLFASKTQIMGLIPEKRRKRMEGMSSLVIGNCSSYHGWSEKRPEFVKQCMRRVYEIVTGYPSDDSIPSVGFTCYNHNAVFAVYVEDGYPLIGSDFTKSKDKILEEVTKACITYGKYLMAVNEFFSDLEEDQNIYDTVIFCVYNFLLEKDLLQREYTPVKFSMEGDLITVGEYKYSERSYKDKRNDFASIIKKLLASQTDQGRLYEERPKLTGSSRFIVKMQQFY